MPIDSSLAHETSSVRVLQLPGTAFHHEFHILISVFRPSPFQLHLIHSPESTVLSDMKIIRIHALPMADGDLRLCCLGNVPVTNIGNESRHSAGSAFSQSKSWSRSSSPYPGPACPSIDIMAAGWVLFHRGLLAIAIPTINAGSAGDGRDGLFKLGHLASLDSCTGRIDAIPLPFPFSLSPSLLGDSHSLASYNTHSFANIGPHFVDDGTPSRGEASSSTGGSGNGGPGLFGCIIICRLRHLARWQFIIRGHGMHGGFCEGASGGAGGAHTPTLALLTGSSGLDGWMSDCHWRLLSLSSGPSSSSSAAGDLHTQFINDMETQIGSKWTLPCDGLGSGGLVKEGEQVEREWSTAGTINGSNDIDNGGGRGGTVSLAHPTTSIRVLPLSSHSIPPDFLVLITMLHLNPF
ncbi:hypothetical protein GYMLUDRAFT_246145 [Collybiopsis luxurians FD-317 M1]|uniref:Uncharacterized protein n=1 Tax=Collybiopsis luxurians FD-317 M1 TaxID=944289 RepID=A0A0D0C7K5_9AGAR|nr:hypothetical protein GYMLUDRAFT_246145 [Collybiopsis luxurians FD-317 M1]